MFCFMVTVIAFSLANATTHPWLYIILHFIMRMEEFGFIFVATQIVSKRPVVLVLQMEFSSETGDSDVKMESPLYINE